MTTLECGEGDVSPQEAARLALGLRGQVETGAAFVERRGDEPGITGFVGFVIVPHHIIGEWTAFVIGWYVRPQAPHRGFVAHRLLRQAEAAAKVLGAVKFAIASIVPRTDRWLANRRGFVRADATFIRDL